MGIQDTEIVTRFIGMYGIDILVPYLDVVTRITIEGLGTDKVVGTVVATRAKLITYNSSEGTSNKTEVVADLWLTLVSIEIVMLGHSVMTVLSIQGQEIMILIYWQ